LDPKRIAFAILFPDENKIAQIEREKGGGEKRESLVIENEESTC